MSSQPRVSVIMNCYNSDEHLRSALDSVMKQTWTDYEVIFWDNCSTDTSPQIARSYGDRVRYFRGTEKVPLGAGRNLAIARARGEYIAFLDCDDLWEPDKLERQLGSLTARASCAAFSRAPGRHGAWSLPSSYAGSGFPCPRPWCAGRPWPD